MLVTKINLTHFIVTLCMMGMARGLVMTLAGGTNISLVSQIAEVPSYQFLGSGVVLGLPIQVVIFILLAIIADFFVRRSKIMRVVFYTGSNRKAAEYSGIRTSRVIICASIVCSVCAAIAGVMYLSRFAGVPLTAGVGLEMTAISACVIGGASLTGGKGSILGSVLGLAFMALVTNAMIMFGIRAHSQDLIRFSILLAAVALDQIQQNLTKKRAQ
jgi:ribose transport system permease protein